MSMIGIDLGGTNIAAGVVDKDFTLTHTVSTPTNAPRSAESIAEDIAKLVAQLRTLDPTADCVGIGAPGIISDGMIHSSCNLQFVEVPLAEMVERICGLPCRLGNDANVAALAEAVAGVGKGADSLLMVTLGTGVGGGIINKGQIIEGFNGAGGEVGHFTLYPNGRPCACGKKGCFEAYCSATALIADTKKAMQQHPESALWKLAGNDLNKVNGKTVFDAQRAGDPVGTEIVKEYISNLALGISSLVTLLQPEVTVIGGGISREGENLIAPLREQVYELAYFNSATPRTKMAAAHFRSEAGIIGAAALCVGGEAVSR